MTLRYIENELPHIAKHILANVSNKTICFYAPMGAGKTTLIKSMVKELGAIDTGSSPTFGIVNEYQGLNGDILAYHFDFYRLNDELEALDLGFEEYLDQDVWIFIEWPEKISSFIPVDASEIRIEIVDANTRELTLF
ncbi:tRNA (adenosine(37)-N6)-threonylcarbamoyltransferase complex ATPase subunit type 1 TsaE [Pareuzebyella sediminis]|uniref:tRNA (adenosine(37)-N6)-threonylcarbamoyltransferase complex ATPase subunit type 1 TsaE n=1 Tax=Pareuzebyella sediminis TaxID=2607998 RepID=UPI0011EBC3D4|nr:tRNA (adenosine(37)-N6)-threonylcarbamoyltransferase complex ATPase subunit type 1 TsaE [Pareuzebyella sediminis]